MQARYYDPVIGRFYSNDPVGFKGVHSFNRYSYANNSPYKYVDPDGKEVILAESLRKNYNSAKNYLTSRSRLAKAYFSRIERKASPTVTINKTSGGSNAKIGDPVYGDQIEWNPQEGLVTNEGSQSPATGLIHEIIHVLVNQDGVASSDQDQVTIMKENIINSETGEGKRENHFDGKVEKVSGPTCRPTKEGEICG